MTYSIELSRLPCRLAAVCLIAISWICPATTWAADSFSILDYAPSGSIVDRTGREDVSAALTNVIAAANAITAKGRPACVYLPAGIYRVSKNPPEFARAGCIRGDGPTQSIIQLDASFAGDLFTWSEAWTPTTPGPTVVGLKITGTPKTTAMQNALVFYDRNDEVFIDNVVIDDLHGRALYSGVGQHGTQAYMRESHLRSLRFFNDGAPGVPVVEFNSEGNGNTDATNEIQLAQVDIYGPHGPGFVIRNNGDGVVRSITVQSLRIEGTENGNTAADLLTIGDPEMKGRIANITLNNIELIDPYRGYAALRMTAGPKRPAPYGIIVRGVIGGGLAHGEGVRIDAGRNSVFNITSMYTEGTNVVIGRGVGGILLDGAGQEACWTYQIDQTSLGGLLTPALMVGNPSTSRTNLQALHQFSPHC